MHPHSHRWHLIDYVIICKRDVQGVHIVRSMRGADCWTEHALVRVKNNFVLKPATRQNNGKPPEHLNVAKLYSLEMQESLQ